MEKLDKGEYKKELLLPDYPRKKIMVALFYEPSTKTKFSFESAMKRLGGDVIDTESAAHFSSAAKGESLEDSVRVMGSYADVIVIRHPDNGSAARAAKVSPVPIINAGDGSGQHPTQALLDVYTIRKELGSIDDLTVAMVGDLLYGRTVHSLAYLLSFQHNDRLIFVSPEELRIPHGIRQHLDEHGIEYKQTDNLREVAKIADVLYVTRIQKERFPKQEDYERLKDFFVVNKEILSYMPEKSIIMHPLPRVNEISREVDSDPRAAYFRQAQNGLYVRMALLKMVLDGV